jgi:hypothetical protein
MAQLTPTGLIKILGLVSLIMVIPIVGGSVAGLILDGVFGTSPVLVLIGLAVGSLIAALGIWALIRAGIRRGYGGGTSNGA